MSAAKRAYRLLDLPNELLCKVLQHISVFDKQQNVQRCCKRFWHLLKQPLTRDTWGTVGVRLPPNASIPVPTLKTLLQWLLSRQAGDLSMHVTIAAAQCHLVSHEPTAALTRWLQASPQSGSQRIPVLTSLLSLDAPR
jgi:hypothetical protein